jgi:hypothetical protein
VLRERRAAEWERADAHTAITGVDGHGTTGDKSDDHRQQRQHGLAEHDVCSSTVNVSAAQQAAIAWTTNFGDSITAGWGSSAPQLAYAALLDTAIAGPNAEPEPGRRPGRRYGAAVGVSQRDAVAGQRATVYGADWHQRCVCVRRRRRMHCELVAVAGGVAGVAGGASADKVLGNSIAQRSGELDCRT